MLDRSHKEKKNRYVLDIFIVRNYQTGHKIDLSKSLTFPSHKQVTKSDFRQFVNNTQDRISDTLLVPTLVQSEHHEG